MKKRDRKRIQRERQQFADQCALMNAIPRRAMEPDFKDIVLPGEEKYDAAPFEEQFILHETISK